MLFSTEAEPFHFIPPMTDNNAVYEIYPIFVFSATLCSTWYPHSPPRITPTPLHCKCGVLTTGPSGFP